MTGPGRPTTGVKVQVRIPADLLAKIDELARSYEQNRAETIRALLAGCLGVD